MDAVDQVDQAVQLALQGSDQALRAQALTFVSQVEADAGSWLAPCLEIVTAHTKEDATQFFALQIIEKCINGAESDAELNEIRAKLWERITAAVNSSRHIKNKLAITLKALFVRLYSSSWPSFFQDVLQLVDCGNGELYVTVLRAVHQEIGDQLFARTSEEAQLATQLKDLVRDRDAYSISQSWVQLLGSDKTDVSLLAGIMDVISGWVVWTDISLVLPSVPHIQRQLTVPAARDAAVNALSEIVAKKMFPDLKVELLEGINIPQTIGSVLQQESTPEFDEMLAKLVNAVLFEASHALNELPQNSTTPLALRLEQITSSILPLVYVFFMDEYDDTTQQLVPGITEYLVFLRREARRTDKKISLGGTLNEERTEVLRKLLHTFVLKSRVDSDDYDITQLDTDDGLDPEFDEFRQKLRVLQDQLSQIDCRLFLETVGSRIARVLTVFCGGSTTPTSNNPAAEIVDAATGSPEPRLISFNLNTDSSEVNPSDWTQLELALYELSVYSDVSRQWVARATKYGGEWAVVAGEVQNMHFLLFGQMIMAAAASADECWSHPAPQLWYMDLVHRYAPQFLVEKSEPTQKLLSRAFDFFLKYGVQNNEVNVRTRSWYFFYRLLRAVRRATFMTNPSVSPTVFQAVAPLLPVAVPSASELGNSSTDLDIVVQQDTFFTSQLHLYEICGIMFAVGEDSARSADLMRQLLAAMFADIDAATTATNAGPAEYLRVHHNIVALSALTKGLAETASEIPKKPQGDLEEQLKTATQMVVAVLERLHATQIVRDACRQAFSRVLSFLGAKILMEISSFIDVLLQTSTPNDLTEFLLFLGQLAYRFDKDTQVFEMYTSLCVPLFEKLFSTLQQVAEQVDIEAQGSTDAQLFRRDIVAGYLQFVHNVVNNNYGAMLFINNNSAVLENVYSSLLHFARNGDVKGGSGSAANQKFAVTVMTKMVSVWGPTGKVPSPNFGADLVVPIFSNSDTYEQLTQLCWTLPADLSVNFADSQARLIINELAGLQKILWEVRGAEYQSHLTLYLSGAGLEPAAVEEFVAKLNSSPKDFRKFFLQFLQKALSK